MMLDPLKLEEFKLAMAFYLSHFKDMDYVKEGLSFFAMICFGMIFIFMSYVLIRTQMQRDSKKLFIKNKKLFFAETLTVLFLALVSTIISYEYGATAIKLQIPKSVNLICDKANNELPLCFNSKNLDNKEALKNMDLNQAVLVRDLAYNQR